jgi:type I restriction enzyme S subunit
MEKQFIPALRFSEFEETNHSPVKFGSVINNSGYGPRFNGNDYDKFGNVKTIRGTDISLDGEIKYNKVPRASLDETFIKNHILKDGDLVMITTADCGLTGVFRKQNINYIPSAYAVKISLKETASSIYFKYFFQTIIAKNQINRFIRKATVANLPGSDIPKLKINIPSLPEQQKIAFFLTEVDIKLSQLTKKKALLENYKKGVMQQIFRQEIRFKDADGNDYGDWVEKRLGDIAMFSKGKGISKIDIIEHGKFPCIRYGELYTNYTETNDVVISFTNLSERELVLSNGGEVIIPASGETQLDIATASCILRKGIAIGGDLNIITSKMNGVFLSYYLNQAKKIEIARLSQGSSVIHLYSKQLSLLKITEPCLEEQNKIANFLSDLDAKIEVLSRSIENTETFKNGLLQQMFV